MVSFAFLSGHLPTAEEAESFEALELHQEFEKKNSSKWYNDKGAGVSWSSSMGWKILGAEGARGLYARFRAPILFHHLAGQIMWVHPNKKSSTVPTSGWKFWDGTAATICVAGTVLHLFIHSIRMI
ncbi:unnamed protein product [Symbiodinium sp. CCMP2592]|nr:unnamed protein product [Symbiodinium sp. CCMP2592]